MIAGIGNVNDLSRRVVGHASRLFELALKKRNLSTWGDLLYLIVLPISDQKRSRWKNDRRADRLFEHIVRSIGCGDGGHLDVCGIGCDGKRE
jgi:hypothetical protein